MDSRLRTLTDQLAAPLQDLRDRARAELVATGQTAVPHLIAALDHSERDIRAGAALCLGDLRASVAAEKLAAVAAADTDPSVRPLALRALSELASPQCSPAVKSALLAHRSDGDLFARALVCTGLGRIGDQECRESLRLLAQDPEEWVRQSARRALAGLRPETTAAPPAAVTPGSSEALVPHPTAGSAVAGDHAVEALLAELCSPLPDLQRRAQAALVQLGSAAVPRVEPLLRHALPSTCRAAAEVLGSIGAPEALGPLTRLLAEEDTPGDLVAVVLYAAANVLRRSDTTHLPEEIVAILRHRLAATDPFVRAAAGAALASAGGVDRQEVLEAVLDDEEEWVRVATCRALEAVAGPTDRPLVPVLLDHLVRMTDRPGQLHLLEVLRRILVAPIPDDEFGEIEPAAFFLRSDDPAVRQAAARLVAQVAPEVDVGTLRSLLAIVAERPAENVELVRAVGRLARPARAEAVAVLQRLSRGRNEAEAREAVLALGAVGGHEGVDALVELANARAGQSTARAAQVLAAMNPKAPVVGVRAPDGRWDRVVQYWCACGGMLRWVDRHNREELRCPSCDAEHVLSPTGKLFRTDATPFGHCLCSRCARKRPLVRRDDSEVLVCPTTGEVHIRPFDHPRQVRLLSDLPLGACVCCAEPQPLIRMNNEVQCYRSRRSYRASARGFELADAPPAATDDIAAINRALLLGTLDVAESGVAASGEEDDPEGEG
jgi:HEAT repeat protein